jgi:acetoin utilization deacetylase AcuC-like enzyme
MAVAIEALKQQGRIRSAYILDFDLHFGDGTENILGRKSYVSIHNPGSCDREAYLQEVERELERFPVDLIGISAGFDNHRQDWGGLLLTDDYYAMGRMVRDAARRNGGGCFAVLEGGYNFDVLGRNALALINGLGN